MKDQNDLVLDPERLMTPAEAAEILRCSTDYVWQLCRKAEKGVKTLRHLRKGNHILIRRQDLIDYIAAQARGGE